MLKSWIATGIALVMVSAGALSFVVVPNAEPVPTTVLGTAAPEQKPGPTEPTASNTATALATIGAGVGLAAGLFLIGVGMGHWKRPMPSPMDDRPKI